MIQKKDRALRWPIGIVLGIVGIVFLSAATIWIALKNPVQMSNDFINKYKEVDRKINDIIEANIALNKKYTFTYDKKPLELKNNQISYTLKNKEGKAVNDATLEVLLTRPDEVNSDIKLELDNVSNGVYTFKSVDLPYQGRWNLFANIKVGENEGFKRLRLDTRFPDLVVDFETVIK